MGRLSDIGPYTIIPQWLLEAGVSHEAIVVYGWLGMYANKEGQAWPSPKTLAERMGANPRSVKRWLDELVTFGAVSMVPRTRPDGGSSTNLYTLVYANPYAQANEGEDDTGAIGGDDTGVIGEDDTAAIHKKEPDPERTRLSPLKGRLRVIPQAADASTSIAINVWEQRTKDNTLPVGRSKALLFSLAKDLTARVGPDQAYVVLMAVPDFTAGCINMQMNRKTKGRRSSNKTAVAAALNGDADERY